ncbi:MAG TPA: hypothetical protein VFZ09_23000 [Archangium sp.]|uniref:hypothetical protein n=1 Tax=Archangium sp. TaxID=1872627 RepID=UPI002E36F23D|nr:hypothetical protein [Archangium sp.]HEX5749129.1 hypothetical protein [Archangium sp.]
MSTVSRRESHTPASTDPLAPDAESHATASRVSASGPARTGRSTGKQEAPAGAVPGNQVETYRGPVERPRSRGPGGASTGTEGGGGLTAGQLALGGRAADAARADAAYADIQATLHTDWKDWAVTDADVRRVHEQLEKLPPADYRRMLERMEQGGLLGKYVKQMSPEAREAFLSQAVSKGSVTSEPGKKAEPAPCDPPDGPAFHRNDANLPESLRELIHHGNRVARKAYADAYDAYIHRYKERVAQAGDLLALRELGRPVDPIGSQFELGVVSGHPDYQRFTSEWWKTPSALPSNAAYVAVDQRIKDLTDAQRAGTLKLKQETELSVESEGMALKVSRETSVTQYGKTDSSLKAGAEGSLGHRKTAIEIESSGAAKTSKGVDFEVGKASIDSEGTVRMELSIPGTHYGAYSEFNHEKGTFGGGVSVEKKVSKDAKVKREYGVTMQGARLERAQDVASMTPGTLFGPLPELEQGLAWKDIPAGRRARMERDGWSAGSWASELQKQSARR